MLAPAHQVELKFTMLYLHLSLEMTTSVNGNIQECGREDRIFYGMRIMQWFRESQYYVDGVPWPVVHLVV